MLAWLWLEFDRKAAALATLEVQLHEAPMRFAWPGGKEEAFWCSDENPHCTYEVLCLQVHAASEDSRWNPGGSCMEWLLVESHQTRY